MRKKKRYRTKIRKIHLIFFILTISVMIIFLASKTHNLKNIEVREPAVAGSFYPAGKEELRGTITDYYNNIKDKKTANVRALIVPHAGYAYSGQIAAAGFSLITDARTVILLGPSHQANFRGASITEKTHFKTPLGLVEISDKAEKIKAELKNKNLFVENEAIHENEHSLEVEIPFLQVKLDDFEIVPITIGPLTAADDAKAIGAILKRFLDDETIIVVSSDFTHYGPNYGYVPFDENVQENLRILDNAAVNFIVDKDAAGFSDFISQTGDTICGRVPIEILLNMLDERARPEVIAYDTSGRKTNDFTNSVSYVAVAFVESKEPLTTEEQDFLLKLARQSVERYVKEKKAPEVDESDLTESMKKVQGCFVTLNKNYNLRGCIGHILPQEELYKCVIDNGVNAAVNDMRFSPVHEDELNYLSVEISVLSVPEKLNYNGWQNLLDKLVPDEDGVVLNYNGRSSTYLPQVWSHFNTKEEFLSSLCEKGGSTAACWKDNPEIHIYHAFVFSEER
ncbi:AmmeMemoRadiSam system protein B [Candidatus Woesearchaeota archaeon]|nr:AmmeMemoRadiSam system protein B [Candidatus Woesearchaeota archaeon]